MLPSSGHSFFGRLAEEERAPRGFCGPRQRLNLGFAEPHRAYYRKRQGDKKKIFSRTVVLSALCFSCQGHLTERSLSSEYTFDATGRYGFPRCRIRAADHQEIVEGPKSTTRYQACGAGYQAQRCGGESRLRIRPGRVEAQAEESAPADDCDWYVRPLEIGFCSTIEY